MNTSYEKVSFFNNYFGGIIDGDNILSTDFYGNKQVIGVTIKKYNETMEILNGYYDKLVELGVIEKEKTPEEIAKEQQQTMNTMLEQMQMMQSQLQQLQQLQRDTKPVEAPILNEKEEENECESDSEYDKSENEFKSRPAKFFNKIYRESK